ncbi:hypothetical protein ACFSKL_09335 [Belliella marina]|uniref:Uncharacterized protein n=1 Tax=Belliella marina TaxID=1644146 RepID=A0ABW4VNY8_9BACT
MYTIIIGFTTLGFILNYLSSKRVILTSQTGLRTWAYANTFKSKGLGLAALTIGLILHIMHLGLGSGIFSYLVTLMTVGSLVVLLYPLNVFNFKSLLLVFAISLSLELYL